MAQITTSTQATPLGQPSQSFIDRNPVTGLLYSIVKTAADTWTIYKSSDGGAIWTFVMSQVRANVQETTGLYLVSSNLAHWCFRTNESSQDRIYMQRIAIGATLQWGSQNLVASADNGGVAGAVYTGIDFIVTGSPTLYRIPIAVGTTSGASHGITMFGATIDGNSVSKVNNAIFTGKRTYLNTGSGRITPSIDIEHTGDGKSGGQPHLWVTWGRTVMHVVKMPWNGTTWTGPFREPFSEFAPPTFPAQDCIPGRYDGQRLLIVHPRTADPDVRLTEINQAGTSRIIRISPDHPTGLVRTCAVSYNQVTKDTRIYAVGTSTAVLYYVDYIRASDTWTSWTQVSATAILGATPNQYSVRRGSFGRARHDVVTAHPGSPNTIVSTAQTLTYAPNTPTWDIPAIGYDNGAAADVAQPLILDWKFSDPDPGDAQTAWAMSRTIASTTTFFRASDSTWQVAEVKNVGATTARTLASAWGLTSDPSHNYKVKVWDGADVASLYSEAFVVLPSGKVNPTITSPTEAQVITSDTLTVTWTVAEQTAWRVQLFVFTSRVYDTGWVAGTDLTHTLDHGLGDLFFYSVKLSTRNLEGLASDEVQKTISVDFIEPAHATVAMTPLPASGVMRVVATNPAPVSPQPAVAYQNLYRRPVVNPYIVVHDFETADMSGWGSPTGGAAVRSNAQAHKGSWSYQLTPAGAVLDSYVETVKIPCTAGLDYFLDMWMRTVNTNRKLFAQIRWYTAGDVFIEARNGLQDQLVAANIWEYRWVRGTAPANAAKMTLCGVETDTPLVTDVVHIDEVRVSVVDDTPGVRIAAGLGSNFTYDDFGPKSGVDYEYRVETKSVISTGVGGVWTR